MADLNTLFSGLGGTNTNSASSDFLGISYSDYASIKNGNYRKLMSAYYANEEKAVADEKESKNTKVNLDAAGTAAKGLKSAAAALLDKGKDSLFVTKKNESGQTTVDYDEEKVYKAVREFIDSYNETLDATSNTDSVAILRDAKNMVSYTNANKKSLAEIGITIGSDNKLSIDEDRFKSASKARVQSVFQSTGSYAYQVSAKAGNISYRAEAASEKAEKASSSSKKSSGVVPSSTSTSKDSTRTIAAIEEAAKDAQKTLAALRKTGSSNIFKTTDKTDEAGKTVKEYDKNAIYDAVKAFVKDYNVLLDKTKDSKTSDISQARRTMVNYVTANESSLSAMGIRIDSDKNLSIDEQKFKASDMLKVKNMFQGSNSLGAQLAAQIEKMDSYANLQASKSNTYGGSGNYTYNYNSGDVYSSMI